MDRPCGATIRGIEPWEPGVLVRYLLLALLCGVAACRPGADSSKVVEPPHAVRDATPTVYASEKGSYAATVLVEGLEHPWSLAFLPEGGMLVTERPGRLRHIGADGAVSAPITGLPKMFVDGQAGLLDVALSPGFASDRLVYVSFAEANFRGNLCGTAVARGRLEGGALKGVEVIYRQEPKLSAGSHLGSRLVFDDLGHLFVTQGENRVAAAAAQELDKLQGKLVRIWPDGRIPDDNPFVGRADARPEIWSYGHRNMQGAALHPQTRRLWTSEHGPMGGDEINIEKPGANYGWPLVTHGIGYDGKPVPGSIGRSAPGMQDPDYVWEKSPAVSGMAFYTGKLFPQWQGNLFLGSLVEQSLIRLELDGDKVTHEERLLGQLGKRIRDVRQGPDGALYVLTDEDDGRLLRIAPVP